jgi:hypothetical protein
MEFSPVAMILKNMVVVADKISLADVSLDLLRSLPGVDARQARILTAPEHIVAIYPEIEMICEIKNRRIIVTDQSSTTIQGESVTEKMAYLADNLKIICVAYGYNFEMEIELDKAKSAAAHLRDHFLTRVIERSQALGAEIVGLETAIQYKRSDMAYQLTLTPDPEGSSKVRAKLNVHYVTDKVPTQAIAHTQFAEGYDQFQEDLRRM